MDGDDTQQLPPEQPVRNRGASNAHFLVVGLGASAGGVAALQAFFAHVPADSGMAYVVILHLSPDHDSQLASVLQAVTPIPVTQVTQRVRVEPNHVYVVPPNRHLLMIDGDIAVSPTTTIEERRAPVDLFFRTLADSHATRAVCAVLSGTGANGSMGLKRIKERGGAVFVQDPREAEYGEMPRNAIATNLADAVLPVAAIPGRIVAYAASLGTVAIPVEAEQRPEDQQHALREVFLQLRLRTGHDFSNYKRPTLLRRIERRIIVRNLPDLPAYAAFLHEHPDEVHALLKDLLISVTNFFRDTEAFGALERDILPRILSAKRAEDLARVWVVGCATGEEAYSLAMLLAERTIGILEAPKVQIFATDIDEAALAYAREGRYTLNDAADVSPERLRRFFSKEGDGYRVAPEIREMVLFATHNVIKDPPFSHLDLVSCRNLLIYLNRTAQERVLETLHFALNPGGYLFLGASESVDGANDLFASLSREHHIFQSRHTRTRSFPVPESVPALRLEPPRVLPASQEQEKGALERISFGDLHLRLLEQYAPPSVVVNEEYDIVHLSGRAGRYLQVAGGAPSTNLLTLIRPELRLDLQHALYQAVQRQTNVAASTLPIRIGDHVETITIQVRPVLREDDPARGFLLVVFEPGTGAVSDAETVVQSDTPVTQRLEGEVLRLRTQLRLVNEQYETHAEELKAANEELQATIEELRSAAEELETSREELQSINEELRTVNQELKVRVEETTQARNNLQNLVNSTNIGTIFLDRSLRVALFTPAASDIFNLIPADHGRPLSDITHRLVDGHVLADAETVLSTLQPIEHEVRTVDHRVFLMRVQPYRTIDDRIGGVMVTFVDISERKRAEEALRESEARLAADLAGMRRLYDLHARLANETDLHSALDQIIAAAVEVTGTDRGCVQLVSEDGERLEMFAYRGYAPDARFIQHFLHDGSKPACDAARRTKQRLIIEDVETFPDLAGTVDREVALADGIRATQSTPMISRKGELMGVLSTQFPQPYRPSDDQLRLIDLLAWTAADFVERHHADAALRASQQRLQRVLETDAVGVLFFDQTGTVIDANHVWLEMAGYTRADVASGELTWRRLTPPEWIRESEAQMEKLAATGRIGPYEKEYFRKDGTRHWMLFAGRELGDGTVAEYCIDITDRKRAEEALHESEARFRTLTDAVPQVIWANDADGRAIYFNQRWYEYSGLGYEESVGLGWQVIVHPDDAPASIERWNQVLAAGDVFDIEYRLRRADGVYRWHLGRNVPLHDQDGAITGWFGSATDIEDLKQAEAAVQRARAELEMRVQQRTAELAAANQALRQEIAERRQLAAQRAALMERIITAQEGERQRIARELHDTLGQFLSALNLRLSMVQSLDGILPTVRDELAQLQALTSRVDQEVDRLTTELRPPALEHLGLADALRRYAEEWAATSGIPVDVLVTGLDTTRLPHVIETTTYRIVQEALTNVLKHAQATAVSVIVERRAGELRVIVEDDGVGFDQSQGTGDGTGGRQVGLIGMAERATLAGGKLTIESAPGAGTTVYLHIPLDEDTPWGTEEAHE